MGKANVDMLISGAPEQFKPILEDFRSFLARQPTRTGILREKSIWKYLQNIRYYLIQNCRTIEDIKTDTIIAHIINLKNRGQVFYRFKRFAKFAVENNYIDEKILIELDEIKIRNKKDNVVTDPENEKKWSVPSSRWEEIYHKVAKGNNSFLAGVWFGLNFGLRLGEIVHLSTNNIFLFDRSDSYILIQPVLEGRDIWEPKTEHSVRKLYVTDTQEKIIRNYLDNRQKNFEEYFPKRKHNFLIYTNQSGKQISEGTFYDWCSKIKLEFSEAEKTFERQLRPHVLRYSSAVHLYYSTYNIYAVSKFLGHNSVQTTEKYLALTQAQRFDAIKDLMIKSGL